MNLQPSPITSDQRGKILKALYYSFGSGFAGGFVLAVSGALTGLLNGGNVNVAKSLAIAAVVGGVVGGLNSLAVTIKQVFTPAS